MKVRKAVIPAAGLGTRVLPATKSMPKEMLTIVDKPAIQYIVEEAVNSGITDILIITNRGKGVIEDHFDRSPELEERLLASGKKDVYDQVVSISKLGNEPFAVLYGDDVIIGEDPACGQLIRAYEKYGKAVVGIKAVSEQAISKYSSLKVDALGGNEYSVTDMVEKPKTPAEVLSLYSILGRCVLTPDIFDILDNTAPGAGGEIQLTDAMKTLARTVGMTGVDFTGKRYDMGDKLGILEATVEIALANPQLGDAFRAYLKELSKTL